MSLNPQEANQFKKDIEPDWLLIYKIEDKTLYLLRTGSHSELFG